jgi:hypothetical protein
MHPGQRHGLAARETMSSAGLEKPAHGFISSPPPDHSGSTATAKTPPNETVD